MKDPYSILGVGTDATDEEIKNAYRNLARKYHPDNYGDDNPLKELAKEKMQEVNEAYDEIQRDRASSSSGSSYSSSYSSSSEPTGIYRDIRIKINEGRFGEAESMLAGVYEFDRTADWHFLNAVCLKRRGRMNDAMRELETACNMDPSNVEYQKAKEMFNRTGNTYGSAYYGDTQYRRATTREEDICDCCYKLWCLDCLCECMGGDMIPCL